MDTVPIIFFIYLGLMIWVHKIKVMGGARASIPLKNWSPKFNLIQQRLQRHIYAPQ